MNSMKSTNTFYKLICLLLCIVSLLGLSACGESKMAQSQVFALDNMITLTAYGKNRDAGLTAAESVIYSMDSMLDPELVTSTVYAMNHANGEKVVVSGQIAEMINTSKEVYERSGGFFDPTLYPLIKRWGFVDGKYYVPSEEEILAELGRLCFDRLIITSFPSMGSYAVSMPAEGQLSFAASAKGCTSKGAIEAMRNAGVESGIVSMSGNVQTLGLKPDGTMWNVAIQDPNNPSSYLGVISVGETAVVTSGSYQRSFVSAGKTYHHLLNPKTGYPITNTLVSMTVICEDGTLADCLSTALFVMGESRALNYWRSYGKDLFELIMVTSDNRIVCTSGLIEQFIQTNESYTLKYSE